MARSFLAPLVLALSPLAGCVLVADVDTETVAIDETEAFDRVVVDVDGGDVVVVGDPAAAGATGTIVASFGARAPEIRHYVDAGVLHVEGDCASLAMVCAIDLELVVPEGVRVEVESGAGEVDVRDVVGDVVVDTGAGDVRIADVAGRVEVDTGAGSVALERCAGEVVVDTGTGDVTGTALGSPVVQVDAGAGSVDLELRGAVERVAVDLGTGDVRLQVPAGRYVLDVETGAGDVDVAGVTEDPGAAAILEASTGAGDVSVVGL